MHKGKRLSLFVIMAAIIALLFSAGFVYPQPAFAQVDPTPLAPTPVPDVVVPSIPQTVQPTVAVLPENLGRISWGAVIAGVVLALVLQLTLNLLGIAIGTTQLDPRDSDAPSAKTLTATAIFWVGLNTIVSLVVGGWVAARFAGIPGSTDGMLHGLMVWGLVTLVTILLVSSTVGRLLSGVNFLIQHILDLVGQVTGTLAHGAVNVAQGAASAAGGVVQGAAHVAGDVAQRAAHATGDAVGSGANAVRSEVESNPEVHALQQQTSSRSAIEAEVRKLLGEAGIAPQKVDSAVASAKDQVQTATQDALQQAQHGDLEEARNTLVTAVQSLLEQGRDTAQTVDRENVINLITSRTQMSREEAEQTLGEWESRFQQAREQTDQVKQQVGGQVDQVRQQVEAQVDQVKQQAEAVQAKVVEKVEEVRADAEEKAREAADQARKALGKVALALFAALVVGAVAAGIGGAIGAPEELPTAEIDTTAMISPNG